MDFNELQPEKTYFSIEVTVSGIFICVNPVQPLNEL